MGLTSVAFAQAAPAAPSAPAAAAPASKMSATDKADASAIDTACAADAKTTGCSGEIVGKGLLKCMSAYKKANPSFKHSAQCEAAIQKLHSDKQAGK
jgi:hypothetical protein